MLYNIQDANRAITPKITEKKNQRNLHRYKSETNLENNIQILGTLIQNAVLTKLYLKHL